MTHIVPDARMAFVAKVQVPDPAAPLFDLTAAKTMYGGKAVSIGSSIFVFASENDGGQGLLARGVVTHAAPVQAIAGLARQTPRASVTIRRIALARRPLGRSDLKAFRDWNDGRPETELNFKLYRQATNKIVAISEAAARLLMTYF